MKQRVTTAVVVIVAVAVVAAVVVAVAVVVTTVVKVAVSVVGRISVVTLLHPMRATKVASVTANNQNLTLVFIASGYTSNDPLV